jgi:hypothetical protein
MLYNYKHVVSGFSARLTPSGLEAVKSKQQRLLSLLTTACRSVPNQSRTPSGEPVAAQRKAAADERQLIFMIFFLKKDEIHL